MNDAASRDERMGMAEALRDAMRIAMRTDPTVFLIGEDIGVPGGFGGGFTVTLGLSDEFGRERVIDTPISEAAIVGAAVGAAMAGMRPVAEMQYGDFVFCAMDQVVNQAAKMHYMSNGQVRVPMVLRLPVGASQRGAQHGQSTEALFMHTPGLKVVCPATPYDAKGLLLAAIRDDNPVIFLEHKLLYGGKGTRKESASISLGTEVPDGDYEVPLGTVAMRRRGRRPHHPRQHADGAPGAGGGRAAWPQDGIDAEVIDVRCLVPLDMVVDRSIGREDRSAADRRGGSPHRRLGSRGRGKDRRTRVPPSPRTDPPCCWPRHAHPLRPRFGAGLRAGCRPYHDRCNEYDG